MTGATGDEDVRSVERAFTGAPEVSEVDLPPVAGGSRGAPPPGGSARAGAEDAPLAETQGPPDGRRGGWPPARVVRASVWTVEDITRDRQSAETAFEDPAEGDRFPRPRAGRFLLDGAERRDRLHERHTRRLARP